MSELITKPCYRYTALITAIYDADTFVCEIDWGKGQWTKGEVVRMYGINAQEIKRSKAKGIGDAEVEDGFDDRDDLLEVLGLDPSNFPRKVKYQDVSSKILTALDLDGDGEPDVFEYREFATPVEVIIETVLDKEKFGRMLGIIHRPSDGLNINEYMRDIIGGVEFYDGKTYPADYPIRPPA